MKTIITVLFLILSISLNSQENISKSVNLISGKKDNGVSKTLSDTFFGEADEWFKVKSISLYGGGALLGLVTASEETKENTTPTGSIGINFSSDRISSNIYFSYNGRETINMQSLSQFGNSLMNPNIGGQSFTFSALGKIKHYFGISTSFQIADNLWKIDNENTIDASPLIFRLGLYLRPFDFGTDDTDNIINLTLNLHYTHRNILGDFNNNNQIIDGMQISSRGYNGLDLSINAYLNSVHLFVQFSRNSNKINIPGFSGSQVTFGLNVSGNLIKIKNDNS